MELVSIVSVRGRVVVRRGGRGPLRGREAGAEATEDHGEQGEAAAETLAGQEVAFTR